MPKGVVLSFLFVSLLLKAEGLRQKFGAYQSQPPTSLCLAASWSPLLLQPDQAAQRMWKHPGGQPEALPPGSLLCQQEEAAAAAAAAETGGLCWRFGGKGSEAGGKRLEQE